MTVRPNTQVPKALKRPVHRLQEPADLAKSAEIQISGPFPPESCNQSDRIVALFHWQGWVSMEPARWPGFKPPVPEIYE